MKTIKLFMDFEFTSLSPDAQPISLGIVSECFNKRFERTEDGLINAMKYSISFGVYIGDSWKKYEKHFREFEIAEFSSPWKWDKYEEFKNANGSGKYSLVDFFNSFTDNTKSFYAEFSDFDLNRCDDWVKENVVKKLLFGRTEYGSTPLIYGQFDTIKEHLHKWLEQFSDYQIQFVCDCGTFDWWFMLQLLAEWEILEIETTDTTQIAHDKGIVEYEKVRDSLLKDSFKCRWEKNIGENVRTFSSFRTGLPKLPDNISPVPEDLNDLIARVKGITVREAFDFNREELAGYVKIDLKGEANYFGNVAVNALKVERFKDDKHNSLFDARVIKEIYQKLK